MIRKDKNYKRVVPRDLFNEAKLLKCLGKLALIELDYKTPFKIVYDGKPFVICQNPDDGSIYCENFNVYLDDEHIHLYTPLNSKDNWPLEAIYKNETYYMFDESGKMHVNFGNDQLIELTKGRGL